MPDYEKSKKRIKEENPDVNVDISEAGPIAKFFSPKGQRATANPWTGNITYYPERMGNLSQDEADNILTHEMTHVRQFRGMSPLQKLLAVGRSALGMEESYAERPRELEAFQSEKDRSRRLGLNLPDPYTGAKDIQLPPMSPRRKALDTFAQERRIRGLE
jgi:hypothetical protein